jgi:hypothetical protein
MRRRETSCLHNPARHEQNDEGHSHAINDESHVADATQKFRQNREQNSSPDGAN